MRTFGFVGVPPGCEWLCQKAKTLGVVGVWAGVALDEAAKEECLGGGGGGKVGFRGGRGGMTTGGWDCEVTSTDGCVEG